VFLNLRLIFIQLKVDIVIFRFSSNTQSTCLEAGKQNPNKLTKASRVEYSYPLAGTSRRVVRINSSSGNRAFALGTNRIDPSMVVSMVVVAT
jgi:hypothetical protein